jgi:hypothetical protein
MLSKYLLLKGGELSVLQLLNLLAPGVPVIATILKELTPEFLGIMNSQ